MLRFIETTIKIVNFLAKYIYMLIFATIIIAIFVIFNLLTIDIVCNNK